MNDFEQLKNYVETTTDAGQDARFIGRMVLILAEEVALLRKELLDPSSRVSIGE